MGKFLESLRQPAVQPALQSTPSHHNIAAAPGIEAEEIDETDEEIPFIEVGPRKSMEASASVLATRPIPSPTAVTFRHSPPEVAPRSPHFAANILAYHQPAHPISAQYRELLGTLLPAASRQDAKALLFAPGVPDGDAGAVLLNLAVTAVREGNARVVIVDAYANQPALADCLGLAARPGLGEVMSGVVAVEQALQLTDLADFAVLTAGGAARRDCVSSSKRPPRCFASCGRATILYSSWGRRGENVVRLWRRHATWFILYCPNAKPTRLAWMSCCEHFPAKAARFGGCILAAS